MHKFPSIIIFIHQSTKSPFLITQPRHIETHSSPARSLYTRRVRTWNGYYLRSSGCPLVNVNWDITTGKIIRFSHCQIILSQ